MERLAVHVQSEDSNSLRTVTCYLHQLKVSDKDGHTSMLLSRQPLDGRGAHVRQATSVPSAVIVLVLGTQI